MARTVVRGTPIAKTVQPQFEGSGINTGQNPGGAPYTSRKGNDDEARRVVSSDTYGKVVSGNQGNANDPSHNGSGVILDGASAAASLDSPVPRSAPTFDPGFMESENRAHLGSGNESGAGPILGGSGVLGRG